MKEKELIVGKYIWLESIDFDGQGNLYFTDAGKKTLYRLVRDRNNMLNHEAVDLLHGFAHISGVSVDRRNAFLYLGTKVKRDGKILKIPLGLFEKQTDIDYRSFRWDSLEDPSLQPEELDIRFTGSPPRAAKPNGVVFNRKTNTAFFADTTLWGSLFGRNGFVGQTNNDLNGARQWELFTPNGIDVDPMSDNALVISLMRKNRILHLDLTDQKETTSPVFGNWLDGLFCLENGDVLVAAFKSREIFRLYRRKNEFVDPCVIIPGLSGCPTDMAIGPSSDGTGESLFITTTGLFQFRLHAGTIVEIPDIRERLLSK